MNENLKSLKQILESKSVLKQDIAQRTLEVFKGLKDSLKSDVHELRGEVKDERIRLSVVDQNELEMRVLIGSDAVFFQSHSNVFRLPDNHPLWQTEELKKDADYGFFGVIHIYNFLAESVIRSRINDAGFLIGRIFVNKDGNILVEGQGQLGTLFRDPKNNPATPETLKHISQVALSYALEFDLLAADYSRIEEISLGQMLAVSADLQLKTSKRLGFKQSDAEKSEKK